MEKHEVKSHLAEIKKTLDEVTKKANLDKLAKEVESLSKKTSDPNIWKDQEKAKKLNQDFSSKKDLLNNLKNLSSQYDDLVELFELLVEEKETDFTQLKQEIKEIYKKLAENKIRLNLNKEYDANSAILEIHPGAGGVEAQDWALMLFRMYQKYAEKKFKKVSTIDYQVGDTAGIKSATFEVDGEYAYGYLKSETGVHRLVRISPFDSNKRRHTSFASVLVLPKINKEISVDIKSDDLKIEKYYSSGAGGQSVNTTLSAVRITHIPTGIVVTCQDERSQIQNKERALGVLKAKLLKLEIDKKEKEENELKGDQKNIEWGSQIRSYVFHPYQMAKDHRTKFEKSNIVDVMDGEIEEFINAYLNEVS